MMTPPSVIDWDDTSWPASRSRSHRFNSRAAFAAVLAIGAALRLWSLAARPGWQYDETVYTDVASNLLLRGQVAEHITYGAPWSPDLYQPPFYFIVLARWFAVVGPSHLPCPHPRRGVLAGHSDRCSGGSWPGCTATRSPSWP